MQQRNASQENAYHQEWAYVKGRMFTLNLLAIGSLVVTFRLGKFIGNMLTTNTWMVFIIQGVFMWLAYMAVDWVLKNALSAASNVEQGDNPSPTPKSVIRFAGAALLTTLILSIASNPFISTELSGESHLPKLNSDIISAIQRDSSLKMAAFAAIKEAGEVEDEKIKASYQQKKTLVNAAIVKGSLSWRKDYQSHKNNPKAWFWTCKKCPTEYKTYRNNILQAIQEGNEIIANAQGYSIGIQSSLSPTLSYEASQDTFLHILRSNTVEMENERKTAQKRLNIVLLVMTLMFGGLSVGLTIVLRDHRKRFGHQVPDNNVRFAMIILDMSSRLGEMITDIVYTIVLQPFNYLKKKRWIKSYRITEKRYNATIATNNETNTENTEERICNECQTDISHKRSDAKFCSDSWRMKFLNFVPHKNKG